jgi:hypothetical protein
MLISNVIMFSVWRRENFLDLPGTFAKLISECLSAIIRDGRGRVLSDNEVDARSTNIFGIITDAILFTK